MNQTVETAASALENALQRIAPLMEDAGDRPNADRLRELRGKLDAGRLTVAFCGHFSAGKSTLVNRLCGTELLPSSPIPTSANVVTIANGKPKATITRLSAGREETFDVPLEKLNDFAVDGESVRSVALSYPIPRLGDHTLLLDTPGIDSTDDAHRMATESALHMADAVFYVMDYNHVQSEINFTFAKQLKDWGKPLYLIVNQIDKHRDRELSFDDYRRSVDEAFANWHLEPAGTLYLSLRDPSNPHSEWEKLEALLDDLAALRAPLALCSVDASARYLVRAHGKALETAAEPERERLLAEAGGEEEAQRVADEIAALEKQLAALAEKTEALRSSLRVELQSLLDNANVTPAATRDLAQSFLESRRPGFKTGLLFAGAKTAAEQERRLEAFRSDFEAQVKAGIEWHLLGLLRKGADSIGWRGEDLERELTASIAGPVEPAWLVDHVKAGAVFGSEYTMNYSRELAADVKALYRKRAMAWIDALAVRAAAAGEAAAAPVRARLAALAAQAGALAKLAALAEREDAHLARLAALLPPAPERPALPKPRERRGGEGQGGAGRAAGGASKPTATRASSAPGAVSPQAAAAGEHGGILRQPADTGVSPARSGASTQPGATGSSSATGGVSNQQEAAGSADGPNGVSPQPEVTGVSTAQQTTQQAAEGVGSSSDADAQAYPAAADQIGSAESARSLAANEPSAAASGALEPQRQAADRLRRAAELLAPHEGLAPAVQAMRDKAGRLQRSRFTIALFGAFSAGKSSLANALLGDSVLPVSPNPTTAAVNRIVPGSPGHEHGTAAVLMKAREAMLDDLRYSLSLLGEAAGELTEEGLLQAIGKLSPDGVQAGGRPHYSFLKAAAAGWREHEPLLGKRLDVDGEAYRRYVAEESRSCFVSEIELYHNNPLTAQGIVLVDTPGADSVNARHTGVAFNYIKNADAILFVTYYNHAFSQADRQFLLQLGRVKDQFELDKMFFIVNAADLAADYDELQGVLAHVERNLQQHGIRFPRMYPVSSLQALDGKQAGDSILLAGSGIGAFEDAFLSFTRNDLGQLAVASAEQELERADRTLTGWIQAASGDQASRKQAAELLQTSAGKARALAASLEDPERKGNPQLEQELKELLFYVLQRVQLRFGEHFNYAFNPGSLQDDGRDLRKALWTSWLELQRLLQIELAQELQATSLRLDRMLNKLAAKQLLDTAAEASKLLDGFEASAFKPIELPTPEERTPWQAEAIDGKWLWGRFKSPRHFFEGEGKAALRGALENALAEPLQSWIDDAQAAWSVLYAGHWHEAAEKAAEALREDIDSFVRGRMASLSGDADLQQLAGLQAGLRAIIEEAKPVRG